MVPNLIPRMGVSKKAFPLQVQVLEVRRSRSRLVAYTIRPAGSSATSLSPAYTRARPSSLQVLEAAPLPTAAYQPIIGGRPQPGPLDPARLRALAIEMLTPLPPHQLLRIAGMLHQLAAVGMPEEGLLESGTPLGQE